MRQMQLKALGIQQRTKQINTLGAVGLAFEWRATRPFL